MAENRTYTSKFPGFEAFARGDTVKGEAWRQAPAPFSEPEVTSRLRRLLWAGPAYAAGAMLMPIAELPGAASRALEAISGGAVSLPGTMELGEPTRQMREFIRKRGGLTGAPAERAASFVGDVAAYIPPWAAGVRALTAGTKAAAGIAQGAGQLGKAHALGKLAETIRNPATAGQYIARDAAIAAPLYPLLEAPRAEEARLQPLPYAATVAAGGVLGYGAERLLALRAAKLAKDAAQKTGAPTPTPKVAPAASVTPETRTTPLTQTTPPAQPNVVTQEVTSESLHAQQAALERYTESLFLADMPPENVHQTLVDRLTGPATKLSQTDAEHVANLLVEKYRPPKVLVPDTPPTVFTADDVLPDKQADRAQDVSTNIPKKFRAGGPAVTLEDASRTELIAQAEILGDYWGSVVRSATDKTHISPKTGASVQHHVRHAAEDAKKAATARYVARTLKDNTATETQVQEIKDMWRIYEGKGSKRAKKQLAERLAGVPPSQPETVPRTQSKVQTVVDTPPEVQTVIDTQPVRAVDQPPVQRVPIAEDAHPNAKAGDYAYFANTKFPIVDASDPAVFTLRAGDGEEFLLNRNLVNSIESVDVPVVQTADDVVRTAPTNVPPSPTQTIPDVPTSQPVIQNVSESNVVEMALQHEADNLISKQAEALARLHEALRGMKKRDTNVIKTHLNKLKALGLKTESADDALTAFTEAAKNERTNMWDNAVNAIDDLVPDENDAIAFLRAQMDEAAKIAKKAQEVPRKPSPKKPSARTSVKQEDVVEGQEAGKTNLFVLSDNFTRAEESFKINAALLARLQNDLATASKSSEENIQNTIDDVLIALKEDGNNIERELTKLAYSPDLPKAAQARLIFEGLQGKKYVDELVKVLDFRETNPVPGNEAWARIRREHFTSTKAKAQINSIESIYWNRLAAQLTAGQPENNRIVYTGSIRELPQVAEMNVPIDAVSAQLQIRNVIIGNDLDYALQQIGFVSGDTVDYDRLQTLVKDSEGKLNIHGLMDRIKDRQGKVVGGNVALHAGIPASAIANNIKRLRDHFNTAETFIPVQEISAIKRSLPEYKKGLLSDEISKRLDQLDNALAQMNQRIKTYTTEHGHYAEMTSTARTEFDALALKRKKLAEKRDALITPVQMELDEARKGLFSKSLLAKLNQGKIISDTLPRYDGQGNHIGDILLSPYKGVEIIIDQVPEVTKADELMLRSGISWYAQRFAVVRHMFGEAIITPWRNAERAHKYFLTEFQDELIRTLKPFVKPDNEGSRLRITSILNGVQDINASPEELKVAEAMRLWYNKLGIALGIPPERQLPNYAPRAPIRGAARSPLPEKPPQELLFFAELKRKVQDEVIPIEKDALQAALTYLHYGARKKFYQPVKEMVHPLAATMHPTRKAVYEAFENSVLNRPIWEDRLVDSTVHEALRLLNANLGKDASSLRREISILANRLIYASTIGANPMTAAKNITQIFLPIGGLDGNPATGLKYHAKATKDLFTQEGKDLVSRYCSVLQDRVFFEGQDLHTSWLQAARPIERAAMLPMQLTDRLNVATSFMMKLRYAQEVEKKPLSTAVREANQFALDMQFGYGIDSPMLYKTDFGRAVGVLASWPLNYVNLMYKYGTKSGWEGKKKAGMMLLTGTLGSHLMSQATGLDFSSTAPYDAVANWMPMSLLTTGTINSIPVQMVLSTTNLAQRLLTGTDTEKQEAWTEWVDSAQNYVPFNTPIQRVMRSTKLLLDEGEVYDEQGKLQYRVAPGEIARSFIGPTVESRERHESATKLRVTEQDYRRLRREAVQAYLAQDATTFNRLQQELRLRGGTPIKRQDIQQALRYRDMTAADRQAMGLPKNYKPPSDPALAQAWHWLLGKARGQ